MIEISFKFVNNIELFVLAIAFRCKGLCANVVPIPILFKHIKLVVKILLAFRVELVIILPDADNVFVIIEFADKDVVVIVGLLIVFTVKEVPLIILPVKLLVHDIFNDEILFNAFKLVKLAVVEFNKIVVILSEEFKIDVLIVFAVSVLSQLILFLILILVLLIFKDVILLLLIILVELILVKFREVALIVLVFIIFEIKASFKLIEIPLILLLHIISLVVNKFLFIIDVELRELVIIFKELFILREIIEFVLFKINVVILFSTFIVLRFILQQIQLLALRSLISKLELIFACPSIITL